MLSDFLRNVLTLSQLSAHIHLEFKVSGLVLRPNPRPNSIYTCRETEQLRFIKWAPSLVEQSMKKLKDLYPQDTPTRDPGGGFWVRGDILCNTISLSGMYVTGEWQIQSIIKEGFLRPICGIASRILFYLNADPPGPMQRWRYNDFEEHIGDLGPRL